MAAVWEVEEEAVERGGKGVSKRTLQRAKESLGVQSVKGFGKGASWYWYLPSVSTAEARDWLRQITHTPPDPREVLGVPPDALWPVMKYHPDRNPDKEATRKFREVQEAWETLCKQREERKQ
jgi:hypothetical protein